jgi:hypothetical protein
MIEAVQPCMVIMAEVLFPALYKMNEACTSPADAVCIMHLESITSILCDAMQFCLIDSTAFGRYPAVIE